MEQFNNGEDVLEQLLVCDFNPYNEEEDIYRQASLIKLAGNFNQRQFETDQSRSLVLDMGVLFMNRTNHSAHDDIFPPKNFQMVLDSVEEEFEDDQFPPNDKSIIGYGIGNKGQFRDRSA